MEDLYRIVSIVMLMWFGLVACSSSQAENAPIGSPDRVIEPEPISAEALPVASLPDFPLSIDYLRAQNYPGSDFVVEQTLRAGVNYNQFVVSYLSEGLTQYALMTIPQGERPPTGFPTIIFNHGYIPPDIYRTTERYIAYVDAFASNGYIVIKPDYRGHGNSEGIASSAYRDPGYVIDVLNALASAKRHPDVDDNRIGMWGHSMGGFITLRAMVTDPTIKAGVIWGGVVVAYTDPEGLWFGRRDRWQRNLARSLGGDYEESPEIWNAISANSYLTEISGPVQIHHGTGDATVPYRISEILDEELRAAGQRSELILYGDDDHNISRNLNDALVVSVVFFDEHVKNAN